MNRGVRMSDVKKSKRKKSRLEAQHMSYQIRKRITAELMSSFALSEKKITEHIRSMTKGINDFDQMVEQSKLIKELEEDRDLWFIRRERDIVADLCRGICQSLRMGNTVFPKYMNEFLERRLRLDQALEYCNALQDELQYIAETLPTDKNKYMNICLDIQKLFNYIKELRQSDNRFLKSIKENEGDLCSYCAVVSSTNFANVNNNGNANNNSASNSNGVRPDFSNTQMTD